MKKFLFATFFIVCLLILPITGVFAQGGGEPGNPGGLGNQEANDETTDFDKILDTKLSDVKLRNAREFEKAAAKYFMAYEAYNSAKKSDNKKIRGRTGEYLKKYREAYADFLKILREDKLYEPKKPKNHAGLYNKKHKEIKNEKRKWKNKGLQDASKKIKEAVSKGKSVDDINVYIQKVVDVIPSSVAPSELISSYDDDNLLDDGSFDNLIPDLNPDPNPGPNPDPDRPCPE